jgi:hypothetical protein
MPALRWRMPYFDSVDGYQVQVARDNRFTDLVESWETFESGTGSFFTLLFTTFRSLNAWQDNESYYWRVRLRHERYTSKATEYDYGPWSPPMRFKLSSYAITGAALTTGELPAALPVLQAANTNTQTVPTTPTFIWDRVEGVGSYQFQVHTAPDFSKPLINKTLHGTSHTPLEALADGVYYWRVAPRRSSKVVGQYTPVYSFEKRTLAPTPLSPIANELIHDYPTFVWEPVYIVSDTLRMAAPRYRVQVDDDPTFADPDVFETTATAFTPSLAAAFKRNKYNDGVWYWRVAIIEANGKAGAYSPRQTFLKEYQLPELLSPLPGDEILGTPLFTWAPIDGAAYYEVKIASTPTAIDSAKASRTENTRFVPATKLTGSTLYWRVQMFDANGIPGPTVDGIFSNNIIYLPVIQAK